MTNLCVSSLKVNHPIAKRLEGVWSQAPPHAGDGAVEQSLGQFIKGITHSNFTRQSLQETVRNNGRMHTKYLLKVGKR